MTGPLDGTFAQNLQFISAANQAVFTGGVSGLGYFGDLFSSLNSEAAGTGKTLDGFLATLNTNSGNSIPQTWNSFITAYRQYLGQNPPLPPETTANATFGNAVSDYLSSSGLTENNFSIFTFLSSQVPPVTSDFSSMFQSAFANFMQNYPYNPNGSVGNSTQFFQNLNQFFGVDATVFQGGQVPNSPPLPPITNSITSFEQIFNNFPPPTTISISPAGVATPVTPTFGQTFAQFYQAFVSEHGFYTTSQALSEWTQQLQGGYSQGLKTSIPISAPGFTGVTRPSTAVAIGTFTQSLFQQATTAQVTALPIPTVENFETGVISTPPLTMTITTNPPGSWNPSTDSLTYDTSDAITFPPPPLTNPPTPPTPPIPLFQNFTITVTGSGASQVVTVNFAINIPTLQLGNAQAEAAVVANALKSIVYTSTSSTPGVRTFTVANPGGGGTPITDTATITGITEVATSVTTGSSIRVLVLNRIYALIASMINTLQQTAAAQAEYLNFLTQWQASYTSLIGDIQTYTQGDGTVFGNIDSSTATVQTFANIRNDANNVSLNRREQLSNLNNAVGDEAKRVQSNINASQDALTQQGQFATSIIQQLTTILSSLYH